jgi:hypothetical protein
MQRLMQQAWDFAYWLEPHHSIKVMAVQVCETKATRNS